MKRITQSLLAGIFFLPVALLGAPLQQSETVAVGNTPIYLASDPVTRRVFIANAGTGRNAGGFSVAVLEADGSHTNLATTAQPRSMAVSATLRKVVVSQSGCECAAIMDADSLAMRVVPAASNPLRTLVVEATGRGYVLSTGSVGGIAGTSSITEIDLRSGAASTYPVPTMGVADFAANAAGTRLFLIGTTKPGVAEWKPGWVQAFDVASKTVVGAPTPIGREARHIVASTTAEEVYISGHVDFARTDVPADSLSRKSMRPALFAVDAATLAVKRTIDLPVTRDFNLIGPFVEGELAIDARSNAVYVADTFNNRFSIVDPSSGNVSEIGVESQVAAIAVNPGARTFLTALTFSGTVAVHSLSGERLDTVPIARALAPNRGLQPASLLVDSAGNAYATNSQEGSVSILRRQADVPGVVNLTDLWSSATEPGWGVFVQQQGATLFAALFAHDSAGTPAWLVMPNGARQPDGSFSGSLYRTHGPVASAVESAAVVGTMRFETAGTAGATLSYVADGVSVTKAVTRLSFSAAPRACAWTVDSRKAALAEGGNFTGLWWNPTEPGWGLAVSQIGDTSFAVLFGYDASNRASWTVMANGARSSPGGFGGALYRAPRGSVQEVGDMALQFANSDEGTASYRIDGASVVKSITRQEFARPSSRCSS